MGTHDGPGSGDTTVDPGQIHKFASLLDDLTTQAKTQFKDKVDAFAHANDKLFGAYGDSSQRAETKHRDMVTGAEDFAKKLHERFGNVAAGAHEVGTRYNDVAELNKSQSGDIDAAMAAGARDRK